VDGARLRAMLNGMLKQGVGGWTTLHVRRSLADAVAEAADKDRTAGHAQVAALLGAPFQALPPASPP
jgi:hypothetical protein